VEEVQELLKTNRTNSCNEKSGWFTAGTEDKIREIMTVLINKQIAKEMGTAGEVDEVGERDR
jgi:hypothetical protein